LIDALDEAYVGQNNTILKALHADFKRLPEWIALIVSSQVGGASAKPASSFASSPFPPPPFFFF
jgi:hypothetical protein